MHHTQKSWLISQLRRSTFRWQPKNEVKKAARIRRGIYLCAGIDREPHEVPHKEVKLDHIDPVIPVTGFDDWDGVLHRIFCEEHGWQVLCSQCHSIKTKAETKERTLYRKRKNGNSWYNDNPHKVIIKSAMSRAKRIQVDYDLDFEWADENYTGKCKITGIDFIVGRGQAGPFSPSLDRINNSRGYTKDNCRFILLGINMLKGTGTDEDVHCIAKAIIKGK